MKLRTFLILFASSFVALTMVNDYITFDFIEINQENEKTHREMSRTIEIANSLLASNLYTTRFARAYIATGDQHRREVYHDILDMLDGKIITPPDYSDNYWDRVAAGLSAPPSRSTQGGRSIEDIFLSLNITNSEFNKLKEAKSKMLELTKIEMHAMDMAHAYYERKPQKAADKVLKTEVSIPRQSRGLYDVSRS